MRIALLGLALLAGCVRNVNSGRQQLISIDERTELYLGVQAYQELLAGSTVSAVADETQALHRVGKRLAAAAHKIPYRWEYEVLVDDLPDAVCLPGGKIAVTTGSYPVLQDDAGLAFVLGHVIAHALQRHGAERMRERFEEEDLGPLTTSPLGEDDQEKRRGVRVCYGAAGSTPYLPAQEAEADRLGVELMARAGYDPRQAVEVCKRLDGANGGGGFAATHPPRPSRVKDLEAKLPTAQALFDQAIKAPVSPLPKARPRKDRGGERPPAAVPGSVVASPAGVLRTRSRENRHALLLEFWLNADVYLAEGRVTGPDGLSMSVDARVGIPANAKKQAVLVRPDTETSDFPPGQYTLALAGAAGGRAFTAACGFEVR